MKDSFGELLKTISSAYRRISPRLAGYRPLFLAVVFGLFAFLFFQYWQTLVQPPLSGYSEGSIAGIPIQLWMPDRLVPGNENQQEFQLIVDDLKIPDYSQVVVTLDSPDGNAGFSRDFFTFIPGSSHDETNKAAVYYGSVPAPAEAFTVRAAFNIGNEQSLLSRTIQVENPFNRSVALLAAVFAGLLALLNLIIYIGNLLKKE